MSNKLFAIAIGLVIIVLGTVAFIRFGSEQAQAPAADDTLMQATSTSATNTQASTVNDEEETNAAPSPTAAPTAGTYTMAQVGTNATAAKCWSVIGGSVYDLTAWITSHPGGSRAILSICGKDGTEAFSRQHGGSAQAQAALTQYRIGALVQ